MEEAARKGSDELPQTEDKVQVKADFVFFSSYIFLLPIGRLLSYFAVAWSWHITYNIVVHTLVCTE